MSKSKRRGTSRRTTRAKPVARVVARQTVRTIDHPKLPVPKDMAEARKGISDVVRGSAMNIVAALIRKAEDGELPAAKYLLEIVGLYPATEETSSKPVDSLAYTLLQRVGLPPELDGLGEAGVGAGS